MSDGKLVLTGVLTNTAPYKLKTIIGASSQYPHVFTEGFGTCMAGKVPSDYFMSTDGYKVVLLNGEAAFVPYVMTFDANGGSVGTEKGDINGNQRLRALPEPTREHYKFGGWYTEKTGGEQITIDTMPSGKDVTVYAHWTPVDYAISYDLADGALADGDANPSAYHIETPDFTLKNPVRAGYVFTGWSGTGLIGEANKTVKVSKGNSGERSYTAHWKEAKYKVTVNTYKDNTLWTNGAPAVKLASDNGTSFITDLTAVLDGTYKIYTGNTDTKVTVTVNGAAATARVDYYTVTFYDGSKALTNPAPQIVLKNTTASAPAKPTKTGYTFEKWVTADGGTASYDFTGKVTGKTSVYAKWTPNTYTVKYNKNSGTIANESSYTGYTYGTGLTLPTPTRTGYTFGGWYTNSGLTGSAVTNISATATGNKEYWAKWTPNTYTITYNGNGNTGGNTADSTHTYGTSTALTANGYEKKYTVTFNHNYTGSSNEAKTAAYTFGGWNTQADGAGTSYVDKASVSNLTSTNNQTVTLYAKWTPQSVIYTPTREGYTFGGWYKDRGCSGSQVDSGGAYTPTADIVLYAKWTAKSYKVTLNENGGKGGTSLTSYTHGTKAALPTDWTKTGYDFAGWYDNESLGGEEVIEISTAATGDKTYWAKWTSASYKIAYELDGGTVTGNPTTYTIESSAITLKNPTKAGYTFTGWSGTGLDENTMTVTIPKESTGNRTYTAHWELEGYTVTLNKNGGTGGTDLTSYTFGTGAALPEDWKKTGYVFDGWFDNESCNGTAVTNISDTDMGNKEYWAKWTDNIAPVIGTLSYSYQPNNLWNWLLSRKLDAPAPGRLDAPELDFACCASADCLHQHLQVI